MAAYIRHLAQRVSQPPPPRQGTTSHSTSARDVSFATLLEQQQRATTSVRFSAHAS